MFTKDSAFECSLIPTYTDLGTYHMPGIVYLGCIKNDEMEKGIMPVLRIKAQNKR